MSLRTVYRSNRIARWALDGLAVLGLTLGIACLHALPSVDHLLIDWSRF